MQLKQKCSPVSLQRQGAELVDEDKLFEQYLGVCVGGLLAGNNYEAERFTYQYLKPEEVLQQAEELAEAMVQVVMDRREAQKFAKKL